MSFEYENFPKLEEYKIESPRNSTTSEEEADETNNNILYQNDENIVNNLNNSDMPLNTTFFGIKSNSELSCILNITVSSVGGGCFTFPYIIDSLGFINSIIIFIFVTICIYYSLDLLRCFVVDTKYFSYALITETILGKLWSKIYCVTSFLYYLSFVLNYLTLIYSFFQLIIIKSELNQNENNDYLDLYGIIFLVLTCALEIFLCIYTSKTDKIHLLSMISLSTFLIILLSIIIEALYAFFSEESLNKFTKNKMFAESNLKTIFNWFSANISYIYGYSYHCSFPTLMGNLKNIDSKNSKTVHIASFSLITCSYIIVGILGYYIYKQIPQILFDYKNNSEDMLFTDSIFFRIILCIFLLSLVPSRYITVRDNYTSLIGKKKLTFIKDLIITSILLVIINTVVFITKKSSKNEIGEFVSNQVNIFSSFVKLFGGLFGVFTCFLLPVINYAAVNGIKKLRSYLGYIISGIFFSIGLITAVNSIYEMFKN